MIQIGVQLRLLPRRFHLHLQRGKLLGVGHGAIVLRHQFRELFVGPLAYVLLIQQGKGQHRGKNADKHEAQRDVLAVRARFEVRDW